MRLCLLPSPLTTPAVADRLASALGDRGHQAVVAEGSGLNTVQLLVGFVAAGGADVVVPHSNAGRFAPAVADQDWLTRRSGHIAFGHGYAEQASLAEANGWEVRRIDGGHLHLLTAPDEVADTVLEVVERLG